MLLSSGHVHTYSGFGSASRLAMNKSIRAGSRISCCNNSSWWRQSTQASRLLVSFRRKEQETWRSRPNRSALSGTALETEKLQDRENAANKFIQNDENSNTIVLDVGKMMCGGCSASVKRILLKQNKVKEAAVNLLTGTAIVTVEAGTGPEDVDTIIESVSSKGFPSSVRDDYGVQSQLQKLSEEDEDQMRKEYVEMLYFKSKAFESMLVHA